MSQIEDCAVVEPTINKEEVSTTAMSQFEGCAEGVSNVEQATDSPPVKKSFLEKLQSNAPHLYYISTQLVLPLLIMIAMAFFFGWILAKFEMQGEIASNDASLREFLLNYNEESIEKTTIWKAMANTSVQCFAESTDSQVLKSIPNTTTSIMENIESCSLDKGKLSFPITYYLIYLWQADLDGLSFNWMVCDPPVGYNKETEYNEGEYNMRQWGLNPASNKDRQEFRYVFKIAADMVARAKEADPENNSDADFWSYFNALASLDTVDDFIRQSTGSTGCKARTAGGALFWFTIMTTIGYGNTAPTTDGGRMLVYTCGFVTIIGFLALNASAAHVWKHMVDDVFLRCKLQRLVVGPISVLFWLAMTIFWMLMVAFSVQAWWRHRLEEELPMNDAYWFSFITITTVGFGDLHFPHEEFEVKDAFTIPLMILIGFNFLNIFAEKLFDCYMLYFSGQNGFEKILQERREERNGTASAVEEES